MLLRFFIGRLKDIFSCGLQERHIAATEGLKAYFADWQKMERQEPLDTEVA